MDFCGTFLFWTTSMAGRSSVSIFCIFLLCISEIRGRSTKFFDQSPFPASKAWEYPSVGSPVTILFREKALDVEGTSLLVREAPLPPPLLQPLETNLEGGTTSDHPGINSTEETPVLTLHSKDIPREKKGDESEERRDPLLILVGIGNNHTKWGTRVVYETRDFDYRKDYYYPQRAPPPLTTTTPKSPGVGDGPWNNDMSWDDATWILTASFIIFTMQTGFGMLESGCVSVRNESNIMMKNVVDVVFGGLTYWLFGFSISFGTDKGSSPFFGVGEYAVDSDNKLMGPVFAAFMFQLSFATTATTIVSGTMAERCNFKAYCIFSLLNTVVYCVPARWVWGPTGFLGEGLGVIDIAGSGAVHLLGGASGFVAAWMLGPRLGRYENGKKSLPLGNPTNCIVGLYILWWGWLAFNSGSTFGVSGSKWKFAARAAVSTTIASIGGGLVGSLWTLFKPGRIFEVMDIVNPLLGALVGITAGCALCHTVDAFIVGAVGAVVVILTNPICDSLGVDDPVGATAVHAFGGLWGLIAVGLFAEDDGGLGFTKGRAGIFRGGDFYLLKVQLLAALCITVWSVSITLFLLWCINLFVPIRMTPHEELLGADFVEHLVRRRHIGFTPVLSALNSHPDIQRVDRKAVVIGSANPIHEQINRKVKDVGGSALWKRLKTKTVVASTFLSALKELRQQRSMADIQQPQSCLVVVQPTESASSIRRRTDEGHDQLQSITSLNLIPTPSPEPSIVKRYLGTPTPFTGSGPSTPPTTSEAPQKRPPTGGRFFFHQQMP